jgi:hypothetical protein
VIAVFLTDVPGVYDRPPWKEGAKLLKKILVKKDGSVRDALFLVFWLYAHIAAYSLVSTVHCTLVL